MTSADKTLNTCRLTKEQYDQLIMNSITSCKNPNNNIKKQITMAEESLMRDKEVIKRMETNEEVIKDHKENFDNHPNQSC